METSTSEETKGDKKEKGDNMGAAANPNAARLAVLQEKKRHLEELLARRTEELRQICIQEAELTGEMPPEMPLEPGENYPYIRRTVGATYQLPENLLCQDSNKDEMIATLELQIQLHANMAEAALGLANEQNVSKTIKRKHRLDYQKHKNECIALREKLSALKKMEQLKHKKKPRVPDSSDDTSSVGTSANEPFVKSDIRHSLRSSKYTMPAISDSSSDSRHPQDPGRSSYRTSDLAYQSPTRDEDTLNNGLFRLSLQGYNNYLERQEAMGQSHHSPSYAYVPTTNYYQYNMPSNPYPHSYYPTQSSRSPHMSQTPHLTHSPHMSQHAQMMPQHSPSLSHHSQSMGQHISQHSPQFPQHSPTASHHSPMAQYGPYVPQVYTSSPPQRVVSYSPPQFYPQYVSGTSHGQQSSPTAIPSTSRAQYYHPTSYSQSPQAILEEAQYRPMLGDVQERNPHQIQPHQQYEQISTQQSGLGGYWKRTETGELVWCSTSPAEFNFSEDRRFGSLDRRRNRRVTKRPQLIDQRSATFSVTHYPDQIRMVPFKSAQKSTRRPQDNGQLVRTQSLGSVGASETPYPSDDNSSCNSDVLNQTIRRQKEKEWVETSLDGPVSEALPMSPLSTTPTRPPPESTITNYNTPHLIRPISPSRVLEIPAESNASQRSIPEANMEFFNNNIPKNCTVVQAGICKPYHEETKPFEMSDFYKYSTKYKKSPVKSAGGERPARNDNNSVANSRFSDSGSRLQQPYDGANNGLLDNSGNVSANLSANLSGMDLGPMTVSENFSQEMKKWYKEQQNNNDMGNPKNRSTATLV